MKTLRDNRADKLAIKQNFIGELSVRLSISKVFGFHSPLTPAFAEWLSD